MVQIVFKPWWHKAWKTLMGSLSFDETDKTFEIKIDSENHKEQIHIVMNSVEASILTRTCIYALIHENKKNKKVIFEYVKSAINHWKVENELDSTQPSMEKSET